MAILERISDFVSQYWYIFAILFVIIAVWLWNNKLDPNSKRILKPIFSGKKLIIIAFAITYYIWWRRADELLVNSAHRWMPVFALIILTAYNFVGKLRYESQQIVCGNGFHGSYSKPPLEKNGFLIFAIDSFNAGGLAWDFASRILVVRKETVEFGNEGALCIASPSPASIYELDPDVKYIIENNEYTKGRFGNKPIFYGWFDDLNRLDWSEEDLKRLEAEKDDKDNLFNMLKKELGVNNPSLKEMYRLYRNMAKAYNKQTEQFDTTVEAVEKQVEHTKRIRDAYDVQPERQPNIEGHEEY